MTVSNHFHTIRGSKQYFALIQLATTSKEIIGNTGTYQCVYTVINSLPEAKNMFSLKHAETVYININKAFRNTTSINVHLFSKYVVSFSHPGINACCII